MGYLKAGPKRVVTNIGLADEWRETDVLAAWLLYLPCFVNSALRSLMTNWSDVKVTTKLLLHLLWVFIRLRHPPVSGNA